MKGFVGKVLKIDLSAGDIEKVPLDEDLTSKYLGALGINTKLHFDLTKPGIDPLGPENVLVFGTGPLVGTFMPTASKTDVSAKSPITGLLGATSSGYKFGSEMKYAGYDHIILQGQSDQPVYLAIWDNSIKLLDASHLWGKDVWETIDILKQEWKSTVFNAIGICIRPPSLQALGPYSIAQMLKVAVGWDINAEEVMQAGERIFNLQRIYNLREGEKREDSVFPKRFYQERFPDGPAQGMIIDKESVDQMLEDYYEKRGWNRADGVPTKEKVTELGLEREWSKVFK